MKKKILAIVGLVLILAGMGMAQWRVDFNTGRLYFSLAPANVRALISSSATGLTYTASTGAFSLTSGYMIPGGGSAGQALISNGASAPSFANVLSSVPTGLTYTTATRALSATTNYSIPLTADTASGVTAYGWGNHSGLYLPVGGGTLTGGLTLGTTAAGQNLTVNATEGAELITAPMVTGGWTLGYDTGGWAISAGVLSKTASTGTLTATAVTGMTSAPTAGVTYKVTIVCSAVSGSPSYKLGNVSGTAITATTITDYITAATTDKIILSGSATDTATITSISIKALTDATGDATIYGDAIIRGQVRVNYGTLAAPAITFARWTPTGIYMPGAGNLGFTFNGAVAYVMNANGVELPSSAYLGWANGDVGYGATKDVKLYRDGSAANLALKNTTSQQTFRVYNTADTHPTLTNYERLSLTGVQGASVNITAETAGTGGDNLDIVLTPAGTGHLKSATNFVHSGTPDIVSAAGAISVNTAITHVVTNGTGTVLTLAAGVEGQVKYIVLKTLTSGGQTDVITPDGGGAGFTTITMAAVGQAVTLLYTNGKWTVVGSFGAVIA